MINLYIIGCGGIGGYLIRMLPMVVSSMCLDMMGRFGANVSGLLQDAGKCYLPTVVDRITMVDGDTFNARNAVRQGAGCGSKLRARMREFKRDMINVTYMQSLELVGYETFINPENIETIIPVHPAPNGSNASAETLFKSVVTDRSVSGDPTQEPAEKLLQRRLEASVVFLCVDNVKTRYEVSKYMERFDDCLVLNGGNSKDTGHVTVYERVAGIPLDPEIYSIYSNIRPDADTRPDETGSCTDVAPEHDQIAITNALVAMSMLAVFNKWARSGLYEKGSKRHNEIAIDINGPSVLPIFHKRS